MFENHDNNVKKPVRIIILGSGFAGVEVLKKLQKEFHNNDSIVITMISKDNYLLFTPMLPEVATGTVETRHIIAPVRSFCKNASFHEATVQLIDLKNKRIVVMHEIGRNNLSYDIRQHVLFYDHLVIALGSENNFSGVDEIKKNTLKMKSIADASILRNHVIGILEQADLEQDNKELKSSLLTFVVVGGGFNGIETVGELTDFIKDTVRDYYSVASRFIFLIAAKTRTAFSGFTNTCTLFFPPTGCRFCAPFSSSLVTSKGSLDLSLTMDSRNPLTLLFRHSSYVLYPRSDGMIAIYFSGDDILLIKL